MLANLFLFLFLTFLAASQGATGSVLKVWDITVWGGDGRSVREVGMEGGEVEGGRVREGEVEGGGREGEVEGEGWRERWREG